MKHEEKIQVSCYKIVVIVALKQGQDPKTQIISILTFISLTLVINRNMKLTITGKQYDCIPSMQGYLLVLILNVTNQLGSSNF